jgi:putative transposase
MTFRRKDIRLSRQSYIGQRLYFITICCYNRAPVFTDLSYGLIVLAHLNALAQSNTFLLHAYSLMPDHLHFLAQGQTPVSDLFSLVTGFKDVTTRAHKNRAGSPLWQPRFYDHILWSADQTESVAHYIWANPVRKGISAHPASYPLSGSQSIDWKTRTSASHLWLPPWKTECRDGGAHLLIGKAGTGSR